jgi:hypothetical protein
LLPAHRKVLRNERRWESPSHQDAHNRPIADIEKEQSDQRLWQIADVASHEEKEHKTSQVIIRLGWIGDGFA